MMRTSENVKLIESCLLGCAVSLILEGFNIGISLLSLSASFMDSQASGDECVNGKSLDHCRLLI